MQFIGFELEIIEPRHREDIVQTLSRGLPRPVLVLNTCQRLECFGFDIPEDPRWRITARLRDNASPDHSCNGRPSREI